MSTNQHLGVILIVEICGVRLEEATEPDIRVDDIRDTLSRVETGDLDDIVAVGPAELVHLLLDAQIAELSHVERRVPRGQLLVKSVQPLKGSM